MSDKIDWLMKKAQQEADGIISVGGLVSDIKREESRSMTTTSHRQLLEAAKAAMRFWWTDHPNDTMEAIAAKRGLDAAITAAEELEKPVDEEWLDAKCNYKWTHGKWAFGVVIVQLDIRGEYFTDINSLVDVTSRRQLLDLLSGLGVEVQL